jgi:hypothetical protein
MSGARDPLSNLAAARGERMVTDAELVEMATSGSAEVARLPGGRTEPGQPADLVAGRFPGGLAGRRPACARAGGGGGKPLYGEPALLDALGVRWRPVTVDGAARGLEAELARRAAGLVRAHAALADVEWMRGPGFSASPLPPGSPP